MDQDGHAGYLTLLTEAYNKGITNPDDLLKIVLMH
jgi:hypothetical protein